MCDAIIRAFGTAVGWGAFGLGCLLFGFAVVPPWLLVSRFRPGARTRLADFLAAWLRLYVRLLPFMKVRVDGRERRCAGPCVLVANHQSFLDPIVVMGIEPRVSGPARPYLFQPPGLGAVLRAVRFHPAEVGSPASLERMREACREARERGGALLFFPEGTRSRDGRIGPFHRGAFRVALDEGMPIQPLVIDGLHHVLPPHTNVSRGWRYPVHLRYLVPLEPPFAGGPRRQLVRDLAERAREAMVDELARMADERKSSQGSDG